MLDIDIDILDLAHNPPLVHDHDPVGQGADLIEIFADEQNGRAVVALLKQALVNVLSRADIDAAGWLRRDQHTGVTG